MKIDGVDYITKALQYAQGRVSTHQSSMDQELSDLIYGISLVYKDLRQVKPDIDKTNPKIQKEVTQLTSRISLPTDTRKAKSVATAHLQSPKTKQLTSSPESLRRGSTQDMTTSVGFATTRPVETASSSWPWNPFTALYNYLYPSKSTESVPVKSVVPREVIGIGPTGMKGIPNYSDNCFVISAYQLVKSNPKLYKEIFENPRFIQDKRFDSLREFDRKYDADTLTVVDMENVRADCLTQFGIPARGHQDAHEVINLVFYQFLTPTSQLQDTAKYKFTAPISTIRNEIEERPDLHIIDRKPVSRGLFGFLYEKQEEVRVVKTFAPSPASELTISLDKASNGDSIEGVIAKHLTEGQGTKANAFKLSKNIRGIQQERNTTFTPGKEVTLTLKRFDNHGNKISKPINVVNGQIQLNGGTAHQVKGFVVHIGKTRHSGHYVEYQKVGSKWYLNDDSRTEEVSDQKVLAAMRDAYILYAERP
ncbi:MAG: ubiquitin carboxyl-terminal hydrolase [Simkaniaceae bacterium]|nr:ubiquitin carboxyl-terminal hydrolase [Simkaniaceae bacterium]